MMRNNIHIVKKNRFSKGVKGVLFITAIVTSSVTCTHKTNEKPNIILILTDDHRWDALGIMGNQYIQTPSLDKLAGSGILFKNAYVTTSICCCSRASILSGQYTSRHGKNSFHDSFTSEEVQYTYPLLLKNHAGYKIGFIGKYGVGLDYPDMYYDYWAVEKKHQPDYENYDEDGNLIHHTDMVNNQILEFLDQYGNNEQPFCLSVSFKAPHAQDGDLRQFIIQERFKDLYSDIHIPLPATFDSSFYYNKFPVDFCYPHVDDDTVLNEARKRYLLRFPDQEKYQESVKNYYRLITGVDECVGNMIKKLNELNIDNNTVVIFAGDNGFYLAEHGLAGKWYGHQESVRIPIFIYDPRLPDKKKGISVEHMVLNIDLAPTILTFADIDIPENMQGKSLTSLIFKKPKTWRKYFFYEHTINIPTIPKSVGVISEEYTYLKYPELKSGFEEFYDLKNDPMQIKNLVSDPLYQDLVEKYRQKTNKWINEI